MIESNQKSPALRIAECCGNCKHVSRPKAPAEPHEAHYNVAKTERWCCKYNRDITRETVCDGFELEPKKGGAAACKRAFAFNKKVKEINEIREKMGRLGVEHIPHHGNLRRLKIDNENPYIIEEEYTTSVWDARLCKSVPCEPFFRYWWRHGPKDSETEKYIKIIKKYLDKIEKEKEEN